MNFKNMVKFANF